MTGHGWWDRLCLATVYDASVEGYGSCFRPLFHDGDHDVDPPDLSDPQRSRSIPRVHVPPPVPTDRAVRREAGRWRVAAIAASAASTGATRGGLFRRWRAIRRRLRSRTASRVTTTGG